MIRYRLLCTNQSGEEIFTIEGYESESEAQAMLDLLNKTEGPEEHTWTLEPLRYN